MPLFTVIIPTRDRPGFLSESVQSVLGQSLADFELLIVNDGSADVEPFPDPRIRVLENRGRGGVPARNLGITSARGDNVAFLDDDDIWTDADHLQRAADILGAGVPFLFADGTMQFASEPGPRLFDRDADAASLAKDNTILISAVCYKKSLHDELGMFDETLPFYWDWDWYLRVARGGHHLYHRRQAVVAIRIHTRNMSGESNADARSANLNRLSVKHGLGPLTLKNHTDFV